MAIQYFDMPNGYAYSFQDVRSDSLSLPLLASLFLSLSGDMKSWRERWSEKVSIITVTHTNTLILHVCIHNSKPILDGCSCNKFPWQNVFYVHEYYVYNVQWYFWGDCKYLCIYFPLCNSKHVIKYGKPKSKLWSDANTTTRQHRTVLSVYNANILQIQEIS